MPKRFSFFLAINFGHKWAILINCNDVCAHLRCITHSVCKKGCIYIHPYAYFMLIHSGENYFLKFRIYVDV
ncbi:hypothetical protein MKX03_002293 [Papaver bracteatum]|nr:hypothetical protein MKX03_002293 [Papaver bracteatum]